MKRTTNKASRSMLLLGFGAAALLPLVTPAQADPGKLSNEVEGAKHSTGIVESEPAMLLETGCGRPEDLNIQPGLPDDEQKPFFKGRITCSGATEPEDELKPLPGPINPAFETALYKQLSRTEGNVFFSPYSITEAMAMVYVGAQGNTASEIANAMDFEFKPGALGDPMHQLRFHVNAGANNKNNRLHTANALCVTDVTPGPDYRAQIREQFDAEVFDGQLSEINAWVKKQTEGHIDSILEELNSESKCVLLNAVYFEGAWQHHFNAIKTRAGMFQVSADKQVDAEYMRQKNSFAVVQNDEWIALELPYSSRASMVLAMPAKAEGMAALEAELNEAKLRMLYDQLDSNAGAKQRVELVMPKFKIATEYDLVPAMKELGVMEAFTRHANFAGMYADKSSFISQIVHKATLEVDEAGTVAAAVTVMEKASESMVIEQELPQIRFDRPFLVMIKENGTQSTLFMGRISNPSAE